VDRYKLQTTYAYYLYKGMKLLHLIKEFSEECRFCSNANANDMTPGIWVHAHFVYEKKNACYHFAIKELLHRMSWLIKISATGNHIRIR
jgi:hypothetical protein